MILKPEDPRQIEFLCRADLVGEEPLVQTIDQVVNRLDLTELYRRYSEAGVSVCERCPRFEGNSC